MCRADWKRIECGPRISAFILDARPHAGSARGRPASGSPGEARPIDLRIPARRANGRKSFGRLIGRTLEKVGGSGDYHQRRPTPRAAAADRSRPAGMASPIRASHMCCPIAKRRFGLRSLASSPRRLRAAYRQRRPHKAKLLAAGPKPGTKRELVEKPAPNARRSSAAVAGWWVRRNHTPPGPAPGVFKRLVR